MLLETTKPISFEISKTDAALIRAIVERVKHTARKFDQHIPLLRLEMDLTATHASGCELDLPALLTASDYNFWHDICGVNAHINRVTGKLLDCFAPRCSKRRGA
jgi:hypothetical protein